MARLCYGDMIKDGKFVINEKETQNIRGIFRNYLEGNSLIKSAELMGIKKNNSSVKRILTNKKYMGNENYPKIIDKESFDMAGQMIKDRAVAMGRVWKKREKEIEVPTEFLYEKGEVLPIDPFERARYQYSRIKVIDDE
ncbi:recombinase family protein [Facklamia sp. P12950]|uniref:recombinase family protein n=1 Tax=Facklamia sp. P12950 TaxID=3421951 RepID=UPI003D16D2F3